MKLKRRGIVPRKAWHRAGWEGTRIKMPRRKSVGINEPVADARDRRARRHDRTSITLCAAVWLAVITSVVQAQTPVNSADAAVSMRPAETPWDIYVKGGPVFMLGSGFLEDRLKTGWTVQAGVREPLWTLDSGTQIFCDFGGGYATNRGDGSPVLIQGFFQGIDPADDHVHFSQNGVLTAAALPAGGSGDLMKTTLHELERVSFHAAIGGSFAPASLNANDGLRTQMNVRVGMRAGGIDPDYEKAFLPEIDAGIAAHLGHGHQNIFVSTDGGEDPELFFGLFTSVGVSTTYHGRYSNVTLGAEVEFARDWFDLGDYTLSGNYGFGTVTPMVTLGFSF